jgi:DNA-binding transcriptional MerR regulator/methylmalonyl-CoA mutase cobalamin-binding subunit
MSNATHPIKVVARLTGLSPFVIRIWEQRYAAVKPERTGTNRRLYSDEQVERLKLLREVTQAGHNIGLIAQWPTETLQKQAAESFSTVSRAKGAAPDATAAGEGIMEECVAAMKALDAKAFDDALKRGAMACGTMGLLQRVVAPLTQMMGELWIEGSITVAHEHLATSVLRTFLLNAAKPCGEINHSPRLVVATPTGQIHELGALLVGAMATHLDWQIIYLGASLPAAEIAGAARQSRARAVALSLVYPEDDARLEQELTLLRELLPAEVAILTGGRAISAYQEVIQKIGATPISDLSDLAAKLEALRRPAKKVPGQKRAAK